MKILIVNRQHRIEFIYNSDCEKLIQELYESVPDTHFQVIHQSTGFVHVTNHDDLIKNLKTKSEPLEEHPSGNPF